MKRLVVARGCLGEFRFLGVLALGNYTSHTNSASVIKVGHDYHSCGFGVIGAFASNQPTIL